ncbi:MAG: hypothetical protein Q8L98_08645 [Chlamydiales bacterium]|nr:hypothetical protein [Chlamydiales bacterium]
MRRYWIGVIFVSILCSLGVFFSQEISAFFRVRYPERFSLEKIALDMEEDRFPKFPLPDLSSIFQQPFFYLDRGDETVAFVSQDERFVLKFFLQKKMQGKKRFSIPNVIHWLFPWHQEKKLLRKQARRQTLLRSMDNYAAVFQSMQNNTGTIALHLTPTVQLLPRIVVFDQIGEKHLVELDRASFILQHKAILVEKKLEKAASTEEKQKVLQALEDFFVLRAKKGFTDLRKTFTLEKNFGFLGDEAIQFDVGGVVFSKDLQEAPEEEIQRIRTILHQWAMSRIK